MAIGINCFNMLIYRSRSKGMLEYHHNKTQGELDVHVPPVKKKRYKKNIREYVTHSHLKHLFYHEHVKESILPCITFLFEAFVTTSNVSMAYSKTIVWKISCCLLAHKVVSMSCPIHLKVSKTSFFKSYLSRILEYF